MRPSLTTRSVLRATPELPKNIIVFSDGTGQDGAPEAPRAEETPSSDELRIDFLARQAMPRPVAASNTRTCCPIAAASTSRSADSFLIGIPLGFLQPSCPLAVPSVAASRK